MAAPLTAEELSYVEQRVADSRKSVLVAYLFWLVLAPFGGHNFYLGRRGAAFVQLFLLISGMATAILLAGLLLLLMLAVWLVVDLFLIPGNVREWSESKRLALVLAMRGQPA